MTGDAVRVLLVDDQELVRAGLRDILRSQFGFDIVGECPDGTTVVAAAESLTPDVVLMDVRMPLVDGIQATERLRSLTAHLRCWPSPRSTTMKSWLECSGPGPRVSS